MSLGTQAHILTIEDDPGIAARLRSALEYAGYKVTWVDKGEDGFAIAQQRIPELINFHRKTACSIAYLWIENDSIYP